MNKENFNKNLQSSIDDIREYIDLKTELYSLIFFERVSKMLAKFLAVIIFVFFLLFFLLFITLGFVEWFHDATGTTLWGYVIAAVVYLVLGLGVFGLSTKLFLNPMLKGFTEVLFEKEDTLDSKTKSKKNDKGNK